MQTTIPNSNKNHFWVIYLLAILVIAIGCYCLHQYRQYGYWLAGTLQIVHDGRDGLVSALGILGGGLLLLGFSIRTTLRRRLHHGRDHFKQMGWRNI
jgi:hypothetical protein